ncbi:hypothetical protein NC651_036547 [Populus alba x Populus x berolinensis]|nr:hypothetical protein NC651_036547 [Populus alba x Populus x berolinensis]
MPLIYARPQHGLGSWVFPTLKEKYESLRFRIIIFSLLYHMEIQHQKGFLNVSNIIISLCLLKVLGLLTIYEVFWNSFIVTEPAPAMFLTAAGLVLQCPRSDKDDERQGCTTGSKSSWEQLPHLGKMDLGIYTIRLPAFLEAKKGGAEKDRRYMREAEIIADEVEHVAEEIEKVAAVAEKVSEAVAEVLPENGKLKETALLIEHVTKATAYDAKLTQDFIHKVDAVKHDIDDLKIMVDPVIEKIVQRNPRGK